jgi:hypothetical protein
LIPGGPRDRPAATNLTPGDKGDGQQPGCIAMRGGAIKVIPFASPGELNDADVQALYAFLKTVPAKPPGQR